MKYNYKFQVGDLLEAHKLDCIYITKIERSSSQTYDLVHTASVCGDKHYDDIVYLATLVSLVEAGEYIHHRIMERKTHEHKI
jgi:hypothetical protein